MPAAVESEGAREQELAEETESSEPHLILWNSKPLRSLNEQPNTVIRDRIWQLRSIRARLRHRGCSFSRARLILPLAALSLKPSPHAEGNK